MSRRRRAGGRVPAHGIDASSLRLCAQARHALEHAVAMECGDERVSELRVIDVTPDPSVRRLRVWLAAPADADEVRREAALERLEAARGFLRARVAESICRKRTPELVFALLPAAGSVGAVGAGAGRVES